MILATALASAALAFGGAGVAPATVQGDFDAAGAYWASTPDRCSTQSVATVKMPRGLLGEATIPDPAVSGPCEMKINRGMSKRMRCLVVVHEYGHWLGHHHTSDRTDPMFPVVNPRMVVPQCEKP